MQKILYQLDYEVKALYELKETIQRQQNTLEKMSEDCERVGPAMDWLREITHAIYKIMEISLNKCEHLISIYSQTAEHVRMRQSQERR